MINLMILMMMFTLIPMIMIMLNILISKKKINEREKLSPFECGFDPLNSSRLPFSIQFYMISIIFLIFDIEIIIFLPMIYSLLFNKLTFWMETSIIFIIILLIGLYTEWNDGALTWMK
uniref:NADH-ubiquinone oxidoreductase chain 3 n=1 Tax=Amblyjoppa sp. ZJUH_2016002 TaxID=2491150 RepID=A0A3S8V092_9HYME|nr:NADH dehydrogenase subunit 3 [Amblyjoppa sp. ZJUH_2016002]